jgi:hypothetical protein
VRVRLVAQNDTRTQAIYEKGDSLFLVSAESGWKTTPLLDVRDAIAWTRLNVAQVVDVDFGSVSEMRDSLRSDFLANNAVSREAVAIVAQLLPRYLTEKRAKRRFRLDDLAAAASSPAMQHDREASAIEITAGEIIVAAIALELLLTGDPTSKHLRFQSISDVIQRMRKGLSQPPYISRLFVRAAFDLPRRLWARELSLSGTISEQVLPVLESITQNEFVALYSLVAGIPLEPLSEELHINVFEAADLRRSVLQKLSRS